MTSPSSPTTTADGVHEDESLRRRPGHSEGGFIGGGQAGAGAIIPADGAEAGWCTLNTAATDRSSTAARTIVSTAPSCDLTM